MNTQDMLRTILEGVRDEGTKMSNPGLTNEMKASMLKQAWTRMAKQHTFIPGDLVEWKPGLRDRRHAYGEPLIVVELLDAPVRHGADDSGTPYFNQPLDIVLGKIDGTGDLLCFHYQSNKFQPYTG